MKRLFKFRYPKLTILILMIILAYSMFSNANVHNFISKLGNLSYLGTFIAGMFFAFGFLASFAVGFFLTVSTKNIFLTAIIGGFGALISDLLIFSIIKSQFIDEFRRLEKTKIFLEINKIFSQSYFHRIKLYLMYIFAGIIIASPLPDEVGVSMLAGLTKIKTSILAILSFLLNTPGIFILLYLGSYR
mgnify:FL=1